MHSCGIKTLRDLWQEFPFDSPAVIFFLLVIFFYVSALQLEVRESSLALNQVHPLTLGLLVPRLLLSLFCVGNFLILLCSFLGRARVFASTLSSAGFKVRLRCASKLQAHRREYHFTQRGGGGETCEEHLQTAAGSRLSVPPSPPITGAFLSNFSLGRAVPECLNRPTGLQSTSPDLPFSPTSSPLPPPRVFWQHPAMAKIRGSRCFRRRDILRFPFAASRLRLERRDIYTRQNCFARLRDAAGRDAAFRNALNARRSFSFSLCFSPARFTKKSSRTIALQRFAFRHRFTACCSKCLFQPRNTASFFPLIGSRNCGRACFIGVAELGDDSAASRSSRFPL